MGAVKTKKQKPLKAIAFVLIKTALVLDLMIIINSLYFKNQTLIEFDFILKIVIASFILLGLIVLFFINTKAKIIKQPDGLLQNTEKIIDYLDEGIVLIDDNSKIKLINQKAATLTGWKVDEAIDQTCNTVFQEVDQSGNPVNTKHEIDLNDPNNKIQERNSFLKSLNETITPINLTIVPSQDSMILSFKDISRQLAEDRDKKEFISTASHEMRTPVAAIDGYLGLIVNPKICQIDTKAMEYANKAQASSKHLGELFKNLLAISKSEDGQLRMKATVIDLVDFVKNITDDFQTSAKQKGLNLEFITESNSPNAKKLAPNMYVHADRDMLKEVIDNLIENAIKYTKSGSVKVDVALMDNNIAIKIIDSGIGIAPDDLKHLFEKFYRVDNRDTREIGGTGLGLYLSRQLVEKMGGQIKVESQLGQGSAFSVIFKRLKEDEIQKLQKQDELLNKTTVYSDKNSEQINPINPTSTPMSKYQKDPTITLPNPPAPIAETFDNSPTTVSTTPTQSPTPQPTPQPMPTPTPQPSVTPQPAPPAPATTQRQQINVPPRQPN